VVTYRTKADHIRALLAAGHTKSDTARIAGASYPQVHGLWQRMSGNKVAQHYKAHTARRMGTPFPRGTRVVHKRQVNKKLFGVVIESDPRITKVAYTYHHPSPEQHYCQHYRDTPCIHKRPRAMEGKLLPPAILYTAELERAPQ
jgi:hypothetical protein